MCSLSHIASLNIYHLVLFNPSTSHADNNSLQYNIPAELICFSPADYHLLPKMAVFPVWPKEKRCPLAILPSPRPSNATIFLLICHIPRRVREPSYLSTNSIIAPSGYRTTLVIVLMSL